ncbi:MAG: hypothetical protein ACOCQD_03420 [archaeon]
MDEASLRKKGISLNLLGMIFVVGGWLVSGIIGLFLFIIGAGIIIGVIGGKIVRRVVFRYDFRKGLIVLFLFTLLAGVVTAIVFNPIMGIFLSIIVLIMIGVYNSDMKETLENFKPTNENE